MKHPVEKSHKQSELIHRSEATQQIMMALSNIDLNYKKEINAYAQELQELILEIEKCKNHIELLQQQSQANEAKQEAFKYDIGYELRLLEKLSNTFIQEVKVLEELRNYLDQSALKVRIREKVQSLRRQLEEIEETEQTLLEKELEYQNTLQELLPFRKEIETLSCKIRELEAQKHYLETTKIHQISQIGQLQLFDDTKTEKIASEEEIIDTKIDPQ